MEKIHSLLLPVKTGIRFAKFCNILYAKAERGYVRLQFINGESVLMTGKMNKLQTLLPTPPFVRAHHSWLANLNHATELRIEDGSAMLIVAGEAIPVSREKRGALLNLFYRL